MITTWFLAIAYSVLSWIVSLFPASSGFPSEVHAAASYFGGYIMIFDPLVPISTLSTIIGLIVIVELALFGFRTVKWLMSHIPWIGGKGN